MLTGTTDADGMFRDGVDLTKRLAGSATVEQCFIRHGFRYFMGRSDQPYDACTLEAAAKTYAAAGGDFVAAVGSMFTSASFLNRSF